MARPATLPGPLRIALFAYPKGAGVGALGAGLIRSTLATYTPVWVAAGTICLVVAAAVLRIGRRAPSIRLATVAQQP